MNGSAPKTCLTGSQSRAVTKPSPNRSNESPDNSRIFQTIAPTRSRHARAAAIVTPCKLRSPKRPLNRWRRRACNGLVVGAALTSARAYCPFQLARPPFTTLLPARNHRSAHRGEEGRHARRDVNQTRGAILTRRTLAVLAAIGAALVLTTGAGAKASAGSLTGAGSSFVAPLVSEWIPKVDAAYGIKVTYGPIGSGGGINAITNRTVDFGASDAPLTPDQFTACKGCVQIPWALSATSLA